MTRPEPRSGRSEAQSLVRSRALQSCCSGGIVVVIDRGIVSGTIPPGLPSGERILWLGSRKLNAVESNQEEFARLG